MKPPPITLTIKPPIIALILLIPLPTPIVDPVPVRVTVEDADVAVTGPDSVAVAVVVTVTIAKPAVVPVPSNCPLVSLEADIVATLGSSLTDAATPGVVVVVFVVVSVVPRGLDA